MQRLIRSSSSLLLALALTLSLSACDSGGSSDDEETLAIEDGRVEVSISGSVETAFNGYAYFYEGPDPNSDGTIFGILLNKTNSQTITQENDWILIGSPSSVRLGDTGEYTFVNFQQDPDVESGDFAALISPSIDGDAGVTGLYTSGNGTIAIDHSSDDRVAGTFSFSAAGYQYSDGSQNEEVVTITVEGEFNANSVESAPWLDLDGLLE